MSAPRPARRPLREIFGAPFVIGVVSTIGLLAALIGDGIFDAVSWATLTVPVVLFAFYMWRRRAA